MKNKFFKLQVLFNIILTVSIIFWSVNLFLGDNQIGADGYWPWFTTSWILLIERWITVIYSQEIWKKIQTSLKKNR